MNRNVFGVVRALTKVSDLITQTIVVLSVVLLCLLLISALDVVEVAAQTSNTAEATSTLLYQYLYNTLRWPLSSAGMTLAFIFAKFTENGRRKAAAIVGIVLIFAARSAAT
ncbi:MAG: hypothetical protein H0W76_06195 [Pyrinomonadaceae bacterium]|nr:hypothetical protein [Pyrinomonadaceae bacterium]